MTITLLQGDCREVLATLPDRSVQCVVTSPPYFGLRRYDVEGAQIGMEQTPAAYVAALVEVFRGVRRVLRDDGVLFINLGDSYASTTKGSGGATEKQTTNHGSFYTPQRFDMGIPDKNLLGIPWRVAFALQDDGWILRSDIIWAKPNPMPESVTDRPTRSHEYLFLFAKSARYYYDATAIAEESAPSSLARAHLNATAKPPPRSYQQVENGDHAGVLSRKKAYGQGRNKRTVWTVATRPYSGAHFAVFPEQLIEPCILAGSAAQACEHCGAPWERVVEREKGEEQARERPKHLQSARSTLSMSGGSKGWQELGSKVYDLGFRPTCACPDNTGAARSVVLDPFVGSGTTCRVAEKYGRDSIGIDLGYQELQEQRTDGIQKMMLEVL